MVRNTQKLDAVVDGKLPDDLDSASISSRLIGHKLYDGSIDDLYLRCRMNFANYTFQTQDPHFMDMGLPEINTSNRNSVLNTPATRILRPMDGSHWTFTDHVFGKANGGPNECGKVRP